VSHHPDVPESPVVESVRTIGKILFIATAIQTLGAVVATSLAVFSPILIVDAGITLGELGLLVAAMNLGAIPPLVMGPWLVDRFGPSSALSLSALAAAAGLFTFATAPPFPISFVALLVVGGAWGLSALAGGGAIVDTAPYRHRGLFISIRQLSLPLGGVIAGLIAPLAGPVGWQPLFAIEGAAFVVLAWLAAHYRVSVRATSSPWRRHPPVRAIRLGILSVAMTIGQWAFLVYVTIELTDRLGFDYAGAAAVFLGTQIVGMSARLVLGAISDWLGAPRTPLLVVISAGSAVLIVAFALVDRSAPAWVIAGLAMAASFFVIGWNGVLVVAIAEAGPLRFVNMYLGTGLTLMRVGNIVAPPLFGAILVIAGSTTAWVVVAGILALAAVGFVVVGPGPTPETGEATS
jgi:sugar phosphate permease